MDPPLPLDIVYNGVEASSYSRRILGLSGTFRCLIHIRNAWSTTVACAQVQGCHVQVNKKYQTTCKKCQIASKNAKQAETA